MTVSAKLTSAAAAAAVACVSPCSQFTAEVDDDDDRESHKFLANGMMDKKKRYEEEYVRSPSVRWAGRFTGRTSVGGGTHKGQIRVRITLGYF